MDTALTRATIFAFALGLAAAAAGDVAAQQAEPRELLIGTGSTSGVYHQAGRAICRLVELDVEGVICSPVSTAGSLFNLSNVRSGAIEFGIAQSDWQFHAVNKSGPFEFMDAEFGELRALFSLHGEPFTVVARRDANIRTFDELKGRRVNIGNPGSGQRATMEVVMAAKGWSRDDFSLVEELPASQQSLALCHNRVQAMVYTVGHPNASVSKATGLCDAVIVEVSGPQIGKLVEENPYYTWTTIPGGMYSGNPDSVKTFGVRATVVASSELDDDLVYDVVKAVFENLDRLRRMHPAFGTLDPKRMVRDGLSAPLHKGAARYFRERG
ncbi:MAG: TAXI family TRAP transporter solute-binding subunit, partial [Rhodospirillales bacterium]|nr:TAXI family TRAP transporter solute-binding subunit [Rhodospirillales bacterium]